MPWETTLPVLVHNLTTAMTPLVDRITATLTPELGQHTADAVARHLCAKYGLTDEENVDPNKLEMLRDFLRRGLVAYVGPERAESLAAAAITR